ncbi:hypothetical protein SKAU_G00085580 [Synaphobranchus kaupii]|uniref:NXPE C-terminal domain-containing protein n=1 Tax=Synaphobranchus kaupii TaxID=118154 RepID=A0A9Q1FWJ4_SYNKA|nr:hypothetical protein SKAU_G00085580 [Synaphobranchus kaupii]
MRQVEELAAENLASLNERWNLLNPRKRWGSLPASLHFLSCHCSRQPRFRLSPEQFKTRHEEMTVDEVMFSLSWASSTSKYTSFNNTSSAQHSVVWLEQRRAQYCVGDTLNVLAEMGNYAGQPKANGGDFIVARIHSPKLQACASGDVTDLLNGFYRVRFHLFWPGEVQVSVRLIHSSEAVDVLRRDWKKDYTKISHRGTFKVGRKQETTPCALRLDSDRALCEYRKKEDGEYYACYRPQTLPCNSLAIMRAFSYKGPNLTKEDTQLLAKWLPSFCQADPFFSAAAITRCLKGKILYILGDSTARQWLQYLTRKVKGLRIVSGSRFQSYLAVHARNNITVRWMKHNHPWNSNFASNVKAATIPEVLDSIAVGGRQKDAIVVIGIGQHFRPFPPEVFIRRLQSIRRAILRLQARSHEARVVIKLENNLEFKSPMITVSDWYGHMQNLAQRKVFEGMKVAVVDAWDMTVAASSFSVHPNQVVVYNQVALALSYSCL